MKSVVMMGLVAVLATGCATKSDLKAVQNEVDILKVEVASVRDTVTDAQKAADRANFSARRAEVALNDVNDKLNLLFKKAQLK
jgi:hypothetical protein